jgi:hypothetical protein
LILRRDAVDNGTPVLMDKPIWYRQQNDANWCENSQALPCMRRCFRSSFTRIAPLLYEIYYTEFFARILDLEVLQHKS